MKKILLIFLFAAVSYLASAQDVIVTSDAETIKAYNIEIGPSTVYYSLSDAADAEIKRISKADILVIKYADGRKWTNTGDNGAVGTAPKTNGVAPDNAKYIAEFNSRCDNFYSRYISAKTKKGCDPLYYFGILHLTDDSVLSDGTLKIDISRGVIDSKTQQGPPYTEFTGKNSLSPAIHFQYSDNTCRLAWQLVLENQSSDFIYVDLSSCYLKVDGKIYSFYDPRQSDIISTDASSRSVSGTHAAATKGTVSSTVTSKNIAIAPHSAANTFAIMVTEDVSSVYHSLFANDVLGSAHNFSAEQSPYKIEIHAVWSKDENTKDTKWVHARMFLAKSVSYFGYSGWVGQQTLLKDDWDVSAPSNYPIIVFKQP